VTRIPPPQQRTVIAMGARACRTEFVTSSEVSSTAVSRTGSVAAAEFAMTSDRAATADDAAAGSATVTDVDTASHVRSAACVRTRSSGGSEVPVLKCRRDDPLPAVRDGLPWVKYGDHPVARACWQGCMMAASRSGGRANPATEGDGDLASI
jgi:hypothetical protein